MTFWEHLDSLRGVIIRSLVVTAVLAVICFAFKEWLFTLALAPSKNEFITYRLIGADRFSINLINTGLTEQFMVHIKLSLYMGVLLASPYIIYTLFGFISPGLYENERRVAVKSGVGAYIFFMIGVVVNYLLIFPLTVRFLGTYSVSPSVTTMLSLDSYTDTLMGMSFVMGAVFELPIICLMLSKAGILTRDIMQEYRRHAIVIILVIAAIITPTSDPATLFAVSLPIYALYELSILIIKPKKNA